MIGASSHRTSQSLPLNTEIIMWTLEDLHPNLFKLYTGPDSAFKSLSCVSCADYAYDASECLGCRRLTCGPCLKNKSVDSCNWCGKELGQPENIHFLAQQIMQNATFKCVYGCP